MRIDVFSIFPEYLQALNLSLLGKAQEQGLMQISVTDLRDFAFDRHRTVDDTPYGGGAGMVMKAEPWALALEQAAAASPRRVLAETGELAEGEDPRPLLIVPSPAGRVFDQAFAYELAEEEHIAFACGRYEGIDERVLIWASEHYRVLPVSLGDYVLNGGEVAVLAMVEAIGRLIPGVVGNPMSLVEESHSDGLLEYPVYTKPASWRDLEIPEVLLSGNHAKIAQFRIHEQIRRTAARRPDLIEGRDASDLSKADRALLQELGYAVDHGKIVSRPASPQE